MQTRKVVRNLIAVVLFSFLIVAFAITGITGDVLRPAPKDSVVSVAGEDVSSAEFKALFEEARKEATAQVGRPLTVAEAVARQVDAGILRQLLDDEVHHAFFDKTGLKVSPKIVAANMRKIPAFFDPVTGRFDTPSYLKAIGERGWSAQRFEHMMAGGIATEHFYSGLQSGFKPPLAFGAALGATMLESRDASFIFVTPAMAGATPEPTEAQLQTFMTENAARLRTPERRELSFLRLSAAKFLAEAKADPAEVQKVVDFRKAQSGSTETRTIIQIPAKDAATAQGIAARLSKGEDPAAIAKSAGAAVVRYDNKSKAELPDAKIADAAFALGAGAVSGPVQGNLGYAVIKVVSIAPGQSAPVEQLRAQAEAEVRKRAADTRLSEAADKLEDAISAGKSLEEAAAAVGLTITKTPAMDRSGRTAAGQPVAGLSQKLVDIAFGLPAGSASEFESEPEAPGEYFIVRADKVEAPVMPTLAAIRPMLVEAWKARETGRRLVAKGNEIAERARKGETLDAIAAGIGAQVGKAPNVTQAAAQILQQTYGPALLNAILGGKKGEVKTAEMPQGGILVVKIDNIKPGNPTEISRGVVGAQGQFGQLLQKDAVDSFRQAAQAVVKGKSYPDRARAAIGAEPLEAEKTKGKEKS